MIRTDTSKAATAARVYPAGIAAAAFKPVSASTPCLCREEIVGSFSATDDKPLCIVAEQGMRLRACSGILRAARSVGARLREILTGEEVVSEHNQIVRIRTRRRAELHVKWPAAFLPGLCALPCLSDGWSLPDFDERQMLTINRLLFPLRSFLPLERLHMQAFFFPLRASDGSGAVLS